MLWTVRGHLVEIFVKDNKVAASCTERDLLGRLSRQMSFPLFPNSIQAQSILNISCGRGPRSGILIPFLKKIYATRRKIKLQVSIPLRPLKVLVVNTKS